MTADCQPECPSLAVALYGFVRPARRLEPAGVFYETRLVRDKLTLGKCTLPVYNDPNAPKRTGKGKKNRWRQEAVVPVEDRLDMFDEDGEKYEKYLMRLDPRETKDQDHYKVLGLTKLRWNATASELRTAYRQKVLKHHPDKKKHKGIKLEQGEDYFVCITRAYEQLCVSETKRRAYDSADPKFDNTIPSEKEVNKDNFFDILGPVIVRNSRWSSEQPVPLLGDADTEREDVEDFYNFWFDFKSWREFSYLDEEDKEKGEDRWERREMEKANKAEREKRRKEETKRIRTLIEMAYAKDPRLAKFKKEDQLAKEQAKEERARQRREKQEAEERERKEKEEAERKRAEEESKKAQQAREEAEKQRAERDKFNAAQRQRLTTLSKQNKCWVTERDQFMLNKQMIDKLKELQGDALSSLCDSIEAIKLDAPAVVEILKEHYQARMQKDQKNNKENQSKDVVLWTNEELILLTKAASQFPAGTIDRWVVIADYVNEHRKDKSTPKKNEKQVIKQVKLVQAGVAKPTASSQNTLGAELPDEDVWSAAEQKALEEALRKHPASDAERWEKIAADIPGKTKKSCIRRFKHLVQMVKNAKK